MTKRTEITIEGPPVSQEMQLIFGGFGGRVIGIAVLNDGIHVAYDEGFTIIFQPSWLLQTDHSKVN